MTDIVQSLAMLALAYGLLSLARDNFKLETRIKILERR